MPQNKLNSHYVHGVKSFTTRMVSGSVQDIRSKGQPKIVKRPQLQLMANKESKLFTQPVSGHDVMPVHTCNPVYIFK